MNLFDKVKNGVNKIKEDGGVPVSITENMINELIKKSDKVKDTTVKITGQFVYITGKVEVEKMFIKKDVSFSITLEPVKMKKREMYFRIKDLKPLNLDFLNKSILNKPPYLTYLDEHIKVDINSWEIVQKVPVGSIKKYVLAEEKIILSIGI